MRPQRSEQAGDTVPPPDAGAAETAPDSPGPLMPQPLGTLGRRLVIAGLVVLAAYLIYRLRAIVSLLIISGLLAYVLEPAVNGITTLAFRYTRRPLPRWAAILTVFLWLGSLLFLAGWFVLPLLADQVTALVKRLPEYYAQAREIGEEFQRMGRRQLPPEWRAQIEGFFAQASGLAVSFARNSIAIVVGLFSSIIGIFLVPILTYFMLHAAPGMRPRLLAWFAPRLRPEVDFLMGEANTVMRTFLRGRLIVSGLVGLLIAGGNWVIGVPYSLLLGIVAGLCDLIPFVGPFIAAVPAVILALLEEPSMALWVIGWYTLVQQIEQVLLSPKIEGGELELNPGVVIVAATAAGTLFGFLGVLLAIPITALGRVLLLYLRAKLRGEPLRPLGTEAPEEEVETA